MPFSYANPTSGPSAGGIGWFNFGNLTMNPGDTVTGLTGTLNDGTTITFDMSLSLVSGTPRTFNATTVPTYSQAQFGRTGYTGLSGNVAMYAAFAPGSTVVSLFTISNITVKDALNNPVLHYTVLIADAENTNLSEAIQGQTNGGNWNLFTTVGVGGFPTLTGVGSQSFSITGNDQSNQMVAYVLSTQSPSQMALTLTDVDPVESRQAFSIGFATTRVSILKNIGQRIDSSDQFILNITGNPTDQVATSGTANGIQTEFARVYAIPGNTYRINEGMAFGSSSSLSDYSQTISASNATLAGSVPPVGTLPIQFTPALGDDVTYTILNAAPETFLKTVDKAYADVGEILTYTVTVENPNDFAVSNVLVTDATPSGTTYIGNLNVSAPYVGTDPASGITITTIAPASSVILSWQIKINTLPPIPNPVPNYANITIPEGTSSITNIVTTKVNTAFVSVLKMVNKVYANLGDILTYTLKLNNAGNVSADNVIITDVIPAGTAFVPGSVTGASGTPPTLTLANPIPAGGSMMVTFQVQVSDTLPDPNPVPNAAAVSYTYTVDPANPNGASGGRTSNTVTTQINAASLTTVKTVDKTYAKSGDVLTYTLNLQNNGNVATDNMVVTDAIPAGTTFVPGSVTGATGIPPVLTLTNPIAAGGSATVTFQVQVGNAIPTPNPIPNSATVAFTYTVNPENPNGENGSNSSNTVNTQVNAANIVTVKSVDKVYANLGQILTYMLTLTNTGNTTANSVVITDAIPAGTTFVPGSVTGATGMPPVLTLTNPIAAGDSATVTFQVQVGNAIPTPNLVSNSATVAFTYTMNPENPNGENSSSSSNTVNTQINNAHITTNKSVDKMYTQPGDVLTYTLILTNTGSVTANNVVVTDLIPMGTTFVPGSVTGATGVPPTLTLANPIAVGSSAIITFKVKVNDLPVQNPILNVASVVYAYTVDPAKPNIPATDRSNTVTTQVSAAVLSIIKAVDKQTAYLGDIITYQLAVTNSGNIEANNVVLIDAIPNGLAYVPGSLTANVPITGTPNAIHLNNPVAPDETIHISFKVNVVAIPNPNPAINQATANYTYPVNPNEPDVPGVMVSNKVCTQVFRYNFGQQIIDLIRSVALEQAALAAVINAEGAKIQQMAAMGTVTTEELLCLNKSVTDMIGSITLLENLLEQKLNIVECQLDDSCQ